MNYPAFINGAYRSQSPTADDEVCINWYVERLESEGATKNRAALYPCPGFSTILETTDIGSRGSFAQDGRAFHVASGTFYELTQAGSTITATVRGSVIDDGLPVTISSNGDELLITAGMHGYIFDLSTNTLTDVAAIAGKARVGAFLDGYFLILDTTTATGTIRLSGLFDGLTWDATDVATRTAGSDKWLTMFVVNRQIWLLGGRTSEVWYNAGTSPFPFQPIQEAFMQHGTATTFAGAVVDNAICWLGENDQGARIVWMGRGQPPTRISTHAIEYALSQYSTVADAEAWSYQDQGHQFFVLSFPTAQTETPGSPTTWVYDAATEVWHQRGYWNPTLGQWQLYRPRTHVWAFGKHLVGTRSQLGLYQMSITNYADIGGAMIRRVRRAPHLTQELNRLYFRKFELDLETGIGLQSGQGSNPLVVMRYSNDGGRTWSNEREMTAGAVGAYNTRVVFWKCGMARDRVFEVSVSDPVPWRIVNAYLDVSAGQAA